jgi:DHA2 family multidrug resistance protein-like MFS transporter
VLAAGYRAHVDELLPTGLSGTAHATAHDSLAGAVVAAAQAPGQAGEAVLQAGRTAYLSGMRLTEVVAAVTMLAMALLTGHLLRGDAPAEVVSEKELDPHAA